MKYGYFDHEADIGIYGEGDSIQESFIAAAQAVFSIMQGDQENPLSSQPISIIFTEDDIEFAFVTWINRLIQESRRNGLLFTKFELQHHNKQWNGRAYGFEWNESLNRGTEVKGATLTMLKVEKTNTHWRAQCVVDV